MGVAQSHTFCRETLDWYWKYGFQRTGKYALPQGAWLDQIYGVSKQLETLASALSQPRPSVAIWGPSQTGKSTLVAKYIDANVKFVGDLSEDGKDSGLHFEGGSPAFFLKPEEDPARGLTLRDGTCVLNPFNSGLDASACLSRFVLGIRANLRLLPAASARARLGSRPRPIAAKTPSRSKSMTRWRGDFPSF